METSTPHQANFSPWVHQTRCPRSRVSLDSVETTATLAQGWVGINSDSRVHIELDPMESHLVEYFVEKTLDASRRKADIRLFFINFQSPSFHQSAAQTTKKK